MDDYPSIFEPINVPINAKDARPGDLVRGSRIRHYRITPDGSYLQLRIVLEDLRTATMSFDTLIQHKGIEWQGHSEGPENQWDVAHSDPRPDKCPGCRLDGDRPGNWVFREGGMHISSTGGDSFETYYTGVWECVNCTYQPMPKPVYDHPSNT